MTHTLLLTVDLDFEIQFQEQNEVLLRLHCLNIDLHYLTSPTGSMAENSG